MKNHLNLAVEELQWLSLLGSVTKNKELISFIVNLDDIYKGADSYLSSTELPGRCLTDVLVRCDGLHPKFKQNEFLRSLRGMSFFRIGLREASFNGERWEPANETLKAFVTRHSNDEVIYFENKEFYKTVSHYENRLSEFAGSIS